MSFCDKTDSSSRSIKDVDNLLSDLDVLEVDEQMARLSIYEFESILIFT
jgi:hypothetical protein